MTHGVGLVIDKAIAIINEHGWTRRMEHNIRTGGYCMRGALKRAAKEVDEHRWTYLFEQSELTVNRILHGRQHYQGIPRWNDHYAQGADDVLGVLKLAREEHDRIAALVADYRGRFPA